MNISFGSTAATAPRHPSSEGAPQAEPGTLSWHYTNLGRPRNFRSFEAVHQAATKYPHLSTQGIQNRNISGSGQFDPESLAKIKEAIGPQFDIVVINLRRESCGFIDGVPVSWKVLSYNQGLSSGAIHVDEKARLRGLHHQYSETSTEKELVKRHRLQYVRLPVLDHHRFSDQAVEDVLFLLNDQQPTTWYHVKCHAGKGRTTQFMAMADMFWNAKSVSFQEILARQKAIGGADFYRHLKKGPAYSKYVAGKKRLKFLEHFYTFCAERDPRTESWFSYLQSIQQSKV